MSSTPHEGLPFQKLVEDTWALGPSPLYTSECSKLSGTPRSEAHPSALIYQGGLHCACGLLVGMQLDACF